MSGIANILGLKNKEKPNIAIILFVYLIEPGKQMLVML